MQLVVNFFWFFNYFQVSSQFVQNFEFWWEFIKIVPKWSITSARQLRKGRYTRLRHSRAACGKLIFSKHTTNHNWCEHEANIIVNTEIGCTVRKHKFKHKTCSNCAQYSLCVRAKIDKICFTVRSCSNGVVCVRSPVQADEHFPKICLYLACEWCSTCTARLYMYHPQQNQCDRVLAPSIHWES